MEGNIIDKIKSRTAQFQSKKESSKLFKTKNKGIISESAPEKVDSEVKDRKKGSDKLQSSVNSDKIKKKKKKKLTGGSPSEVDIESDFSSKAKKRKKI